METSLNSMKEKPVSLIKRKISAVDLVTVVIFAVLYRVLWYFFKFAGIVFPFNHSFVYLFSAFCLVLCWVVVRKPYASVYFTVAWCAINFFLQGELPVYWALVIVAPLLPEMYLNARSKSLKKPEDVYINTKDLIVAALIYNIIYEVFVWWTVIDIYKIPVPFNLLAIVFGISIVGMVIGVIIAKPLGIKLKNLIG